MRYCECGEDGAEVLDCHRCGRRRCEDCATRVEVENQCCRECALIMEPPPTEKTPIMPNPLDLERVRNYIKQWRQAAAESEFHDSEYGDMAFADLPAAVEEIAALRAELERAREHYTHFQETSARAGMELINERDELRQQLAALRNAQERK